MFPAVDFDRFRPHDASQWRRDLGFDDEDILYFSPRSYTQPYYNIDIIIQAATKVKNQNPRARFLFAGYEGDPEPFRKKARDAGIEDVMTMLGRIPHNEFATALTACDVFISVPSVDATAVSLLEAMSCARGIIISSLPSSVEWITDGISGLVVSPRNVEELAVAMLKLGNDEELRNKYGLAAMEYAHEWAGFDTNMTYVDQIFNQLIDGSGTWPAKVCLPVLQKFNEIG